MDNLYIKNNTIESRSKIVIYKDDSQIFNPTEEMLFEDGWSVYTPPVQELIETPHEEQYKNRIVELIREKYSIDDELSIQRQRHTKIDEFNAYNSFVEECKVQAREELGL